ncbi:27961_t:CDS:2, partial [Dentiscutata erythropus]
AIAQEYFIDDSDREIEEIPWSKQDCKKLYSNNLTKNLAVKLPGTVKRGYKSGPEPIDIDEIYLIEVSRWEEPTQGLEFEENEKNYPTYTNFEQSWYETNNNDSFSEFPNMDLDSEEWLQSMDEYINWEYYDFL